MKKQIILIFTIILVVLLLINIDKLYNVYFETISKNVKPDKLVIIIDPGHGGFDPGKVGINGALEKDINLEISKKLKQLLELNDIEAILTREDDNGLYSDFDSNKKRSDLNKRIQLIKDANADFAISIHQNSFEQEAIKGAQVFYHIKSEEGKVLATYIQEQLKTTLKDGNHRNIKQNNSYYMLKKSDCPLVIVECGYLSNNMEANLLIKDEYQEKVAWAIHLAVIKYINSKK